jgi:hypothetical protein
VLDVRKADGKSAAIGARVAVQVGSLRQIADVAPVKGYLSQHDPRLHFGLGAAARADSIEVRWPNGKTTRLQNINANQYLKVVDDAR